MGNCLKSCFGSVNTKRNKYFTGRYNNASIDIEFENLIEDDDVQQNHAVLTDEEREFLLNRRYADLVQEQQKVDAKLDKELELEEENARLEEEAYHAARREAARATNQARALERQKRQNKTQSNGSAKAWLGGDTGDWEIATEDDFETFLETVKAKSETVRASVASMLNNHTTPLTTNPNLVSPPTSPTVQSPSPVAQVASTSSATSPNVAHAATSTKETSFSTLSSSGSGMESQGGKLVASPEREEKGGSGASKGLVGVSGQGSPSKSSDKPDVVVVDGASSQGATLGQGDKEEGLEGTGGMSYYVKPGRETSNNHGGDNDDSDVEWEADFVSADSTPEPIKVPLVTSSSKSSTTSSTTNHQTVGSSNSSTIPSRYQTGLPSQSRTNGPNLANGKLPYSTHNQESEIIAGSTSTSTPTSATGKSKASASSDATATVKPKKTLDIDIDKFLEELDFDT